ncbi:MAG: hypothetical protein OXF23_08005 [Candidatus Dadabacteria bacterium]|nr:hypothetical protein [Candidatus Dadabacteria bacterium]
MANSSPDYAGFFPFGWLRGVREDNWQIFWSKQTGDIFLKSTLGSTLVKVGEVSQWTEAKKKADFLIENSDSLPEEIFDH